MEDKNSLGTTRTPERTARRQAGIPLDPDAAIRVNRREFLGTAAAAGALAALAPKTGEARTNAREVRTLFFNFSNHPDVDTSNFYACIAGRIYPLARTGASHPALLQAQQTNAFLGAVPSSAMTHVLENVQTPADSLSLNYTFANTDPVTGTWSMSHFFVLTPKQSLAKAYQQTKKTLAVGEPLPLSAKRDFYGVGPAMTSRTS